MKRNWKYIGIILTVVLTTSLIFFYLGLEYFYYGDFGCGCSSACVGYYVSTVSKFLGWTLLILSISLFIASTWRVKQISILWTIPSTIVFMIAFYGNGYMIFNKGACGESINRRTFFVFQEHLGDFAKIDGEYFSFDSLQEKKYNSKLLGYLINGNSLTIYRIADSPLELKTGFLFWQPDKEQMRKDFSYGLNTYREPPHDTLPLKQIELIGGKDMPIEAFMQELELTNHWGFTKIVSNELIHSDDGTTRLKLRVK